MKLNYLKNQIGKGESETLEFKKSTAKLKTVGATMCAFLNNKGGIILIGVTDSNKIVGQHVTDNTQREIANLLKRIEPFPLVKIDYVDIPNKDKKVIVIKTKHSNHAGPYIFDGSPYQRNQTTTSLMSQEHYQGLLLEKISNPKHWELLPANNMAIRDLDEDEILLTIQEGIVKGRIRGKYTTNNPKKALVHMKLLDDTKPMLLLSYLQKMYCLIMRNV